MEATIRRITVRSKKQAMDWSLVLASQGIEPTITNVENGWELIVEEADYEKSLATLHQYQKENRGWKWQKHLPGSNLVFHWGSAIWAIALLLFHYWSSVRFPGTKNFGIMDNRAVFSGEWWRPFTAVTLHGDINHALANATIGFLLLGLAMARYGFGCALLAAYLAGVAGNFTGLIFYSDFHRSLGASGMVTAALGLLAVQLFSDWRHNFWRRKTLIRSATGGILLFVLIGFGENTDVLAHVGGFFFGFLFGCVLSFFPHGFLEKRFVNQIAFLVFGAAMVLAWGMALH